jgi:Ribbon-helix-helix protein, copG family
VSYYCLMVKTTLYLEETIVHVLEELASEEGRSQGEVVREALLVYRGQQTRPAPKGIGKYRSGRSDVSARAEELLREAAHRDR